jgi:hypothetical protein
MRTALLFAAAAVCLQAQSQTPYFLQEHSGSTFNYSIPVDIEFDGANMVYSLHADQQGSGVDIVQYNALSGAVNYVNYLIRGNAGLKPVRVRATATTYYVLFNSVSGAGVAGYCLVSINSGSHAVNWAQACFPPTGAAPRTAIDFILDAGATNAYILTSAYDAINNQNDVGITNISIAGPPSIVWDNIYQNTARNEEPSNIVYRSASNELIVSTISWDLANPVIDRGPVLMRVAPTGLYTASMLYRYNTGCNHAEPSGTWVLLGPSNLYLSSTSTDNGANGPLWLSKINPATLGINLQSNHPTGTNYLKPEIQGVFGTLASQVLISGSSTSLDYVHLEFTTSALAFSSGVVYPSTNAQIGSPIYDVYNTTGIGMNIFSVAQNMVTPNHYYFLKTDDLGGNDCDDPITVAPDQCGMSTFNVSFTQVPVALTPALPICSTSPRANLFTQPCFVPMVLAPMTSRETRSTIGTELTVSPNPTKGVFVLSAGKSSLSDVQIFNPDGKVVPAEVSEKSEGTSVNLTGRKAGVYVVQVSVDGEPKTVRLVLE